MSPMLHSRCKKRLVIERLLAVVRPFDVLGYPRRLLRQLARRLDEFAEVLVPSIPPSVRMNRDLKWFLLNHDFTSSLITLALFYTMSIQLKQKASQKDLDRHTPICLNMKLDSN